MEVILRITLSASITQDLSEGLSDQQPALMALRSVHGERGIHSSVLGPQAGPGVIALRTSFDCQDPECWAYGVWGQGLASSRLLVSADCWMMP